MSYKNEFASGESLISLQQSNVFNDFKGEIKEQETTQAPEITPIEIPFTEKNIDRVIAIDGSIVTQTIENGFPGAEASLVQLALVYINLKKLNNFNPQNIIPPSVFNEMDKAKTLQTVLPGRNVIRKYDNLPPKDFFRASVFESLQGKVVQTGHETLLDTFHSLVKDRKTKFRCPHHGNLCEHSLIPVLGKTTCSCENRKTIYSTDQLRFHERFNEAGSNGECHGEVMRFLEIILLLNVMRYFLTSEQTVKILPDIAFVLDGPLAVFGQFAAIAPRVREEIKRIDKECYKRTGKHILLLSMIKTGQFVEHFEMIDFHKKKGPGKKFPERSIFKPNIDYIHSSIVYRAPGSKEWGKDTYFGRIVFYKNRSGQRMLVNTPRTTDESDDLNNTTSNAFPRLKEILGIVDRLSTYLFEGGFIPLVRAHSHAAIPLKLGGEILKNLFEDDEK